MNPAGKGMQHEQLNRDKVQHEKSVPLESHNSPLCDIDLKDILNFEEFVKYLTNEEQQKLLQYLPRPDTAKLPDSLESMFETPQFKENLCYFQQLLEEGVFNISVHGVIAEDCKTLKRLALCNLTKSHWVECHLTHKKCTSVQGPVTAGGPNAIASSNSINMKRSRDNQIQHFPESRTLKSPKRVIMKASCENKELIDNDELFHPALSFGTQASPSSSWVHSHSIHP
ncbi:GATA transcription factor 26 [Hibiscus trionum]|uniref:GATA transcription factor 26 n=1 Tax=Hibiscus trionum TaxID=183268 RepID=A0A9W7LGJ4_HIBTR|nr:GATA transcription factor 26 [Hibiscus trionum]